MTRGTIIIAAYNEEAVIGRSLDALADVGDDVRVVVVCNGCTDSTADRARSRPNVSVIELPVASKALALREGDRQALPGPRIYLDADVQLESSAARAVLRALSGGAVAGRPPHVFDTRRSSWIVRQWYAVRADLTSISTALWGAGCYALSDVGRARFDEFPEIVSDDLFVDSLFSRDEICIVDTAPVIVTAPRRLSGLLQVLRRSYRTQGEIERPASSPVGGKRAQLGDLGSIVRRTPWRIGQVAIYCLVVLAARVQAGRTRSTATWERDTTSRE